MTQSKPIRTLIRTLKLKPHPEGGYFRETYRSKGQIPYPALPSVYKGDRAFGTAIYYLLTQGSVSRLHRLASDEVFHFYSGGPLVLVQIKPDGKVLKTVLGSKLKKRHVFQHAVPAGDWFGCYLPSRVAFALLGCTVAPGFDFADFETGQREQLLKSFPKARPDILRLTSPL